ncbi:hypothetical protein Q8F55_008167 [Vanrija albida]|uniref:Diacylglycerol O-acyltransferase n=1 Tax=Vanrija albida TaxID=181172 RepID=A0ABR3PVL2_9TREE
MDMTLHERFSLTRQTIGHPTIITAALSYPSAAAAPSASYLRARIATLQAHFPLLYAQLHDVETRAPYFLPRDAAWPADAIFAEAPLESDADDELDAAITQELYRFERADLWAGPLWSVRLLTAASGRVYLVLSTMHTIIDGRGTQLLLLALAGQPEQLPTEAWNDTKRADDTINIKPSLGFLLPVAWRELVFPKLPGILQSVLSYTPLRGTSPVWPLVEAAADAPKKPSPIDCQSVTRFVSLEPALLTALKDKGKAAGVMTLHPLLEAAVFAAMWATLGPADASETFWVEVSTPRSERSEALGHGFCMGNYVSSQPFTSGLKPADKYWDLARAVSAFNKSESGITSGRMQMGLLLHVPDPEPAPTAEHPDRKITGWETFFTTKARGANPYTSSACLSNLGFTELPPGAESVGWAQSADALSSALSISAIGSAGGLRVATSWKEGAIVDEKTLLALHDVFERVLRRVVAGDDTEALTLAQVTAE